MTLTELRSQAALLDDTEQREFIDFLIRQRRLDDEAGGDSITRKIEDNNPAHRSDCDGFKRSIEC
jgi:hypothetical protein